MSCAGAVCDRSVLKIATSAVCVAAKYSCGAWRGLKIAVGAVQGDTVDV